MGSGKSFWGKKLAEEMTYSFIDTDVEIQKQEGKLVQDIFTQKGEKCFRQLERNWLSDFDKQNHVIATGGGMPISNENLNLMKEKGKVVFIDEPFEICFNRIQESERPLLHLNKSELQNLFKSRMATYEKANVILESPRKVSDFIQCLN